MRRTHPIRGLGALLGLGVALLVVGCNGGENDVQTLKSLPRAADVEAAVSRGDGIAPSSYAGEFQVKVDRDLVAREKSIPYVLYAGLDEAGPTRIGVNAFLDMRELQTALPSVLSGPVDEACNRNIVLDLAGVRTEGSQVRAWGTVQAMLYRCRKRDTEDEARGVRYLSQTVDAVAAVTATVQNECILFQLDALELDPQGVLGGLSNLFGITNLIRDALLKKAEEILKENPICPDLPSELVSLTPSFDEGGTREIGAGGLGAALSGSVDVSPATMIAVLSFVKERKLVEGQQ